MRPFHLVFDAGDGVGNQAFDLESSAFLRTEAGALVEQGIG